YDFTELGRIIVADRRVQRRRPDRDRFQLRNFPGGNSDFFTEFVIGRFAAQLLAHLQGDAAHLGNFVHQMHGQANGLRLVSERAFDRLLNPPRGVSGKFSTFRRIETFDRFHQPDVSLRNQIEQRQSKIRVVVRDLHHQAQIRTNHQGASFLVAALNFSGEFNLLLGSEQWDLPDLAQVNFYSSIAIFSSQKTSLHERERGVQYAFSDYLGFAGIPQSQHLSRAKVLNKVKYSHF